MLGYLPVVVPVVSPRAALELYGLLVAGLTAALVVLMSSRRIAVNAWLKLRPALKGRPDDVRFLDAWFHGTGLTLWLTSIVVAPMIGALVLISPWMSLIAMAGTAAAVKGMMGWSNASQILAQMERVAIPRFGWPSGLGMAAVTIVITLLAAPLVVSRIGDGIATARGIHGARLDVIEGDIARLSAHTPDLRSFYEAKIGAEQELVGHERAALAKGVSSPSAVATARVRALDADIALRNASASLAETMSRLVRERQDTQNRLRSLSSIAPALHPQ